MPVYCRHGSVNVISCFLKVQAFICLLVKCESHTSEEDCPDTYLLITVGVGSEKEH